ncbi:Hsp70 family protein [Xanthomonas floridensis]|uniref:Heat-shock protein Hsp70 n=1 Tax=Xanthomonas floridensis TaxID=1843580 RepID=A0A1A9MBG4_9XANT|nr:Hsp70 family protein [Xanthomonas floridensis]MEA5125290.1 Hsp70 family protein [Xanthomonas floridensis]MEA5133024.1 Hsp70 family protein [Xanthomonas floridensis]OAG67421.1 heat-shock protein Hsp70 [Xanthomonas floridensis]
MKLGIDFGTSNSAAAAIVDGQVEPVRFGEALQFRTTVYFPETMRDPEDFSLTPALEYEMERLIDSARRDATAAGRASNPDSLRRDALRVVRRQWMEQQVREPRSSAALLQNAVYGDEALDAYFLEGEGNLVQSPKSMLGYNLHPRARQTITGIATHVLEHIRLTASRQFDINIRAAVLGRPVQFRSSIGDAGNAQALDILQTAAIAAGFDSVEFLEEPAAAAMHYHVSHDSRHETVVVDIGGGTTDIAHASVGGSTAPQVHRAWGIARGGTDIDLALSLASYMPLFGRGTTRVPAHHYVEAAMVQDMTRQREFRLHNYQDAPAPFDTRLKALQDTGNTARLYRHVEACKIALSEADQHHTALDFIERGLQVDVQADALVASASSYLRELEALLAQVRADMAAPPATLFLTGGMSRAGYLRDAVAAAFPESRMVQGDPSFGVVQGLAWAAAGGARPSDG